MWAEGRSDWQPLSSVPELMTGVYHHGVEYSAPGKKVSLYFQPCETGLSLHMLNAVQNQPTMMMSMRNSKRK